MTVSKELQRGDPAPVFIQRSSSNAQFIFDTAAGRPLLLCFFGSSTDPHAQAAIAAVEARRDLFDDRRAAFFGVTQDKADEAGGVTPRLPGYRYFWDDDGKVGKLYGALPASFRGGADIPAMARRWVLVDRSLRIVAVVPFASDRSDIARALALVEEQPDPADPELAARPAPVLSVPDVFEPELCRTLLDFAARNESRESGYMVDREGQTRLEYDRHKKRRRDFLIEDEKLREQMRMRIIRRLAPEIGKAFQFQPTRIERYMIGHYSQRDAGFFHPHRDNTTRGTAHRQFAVTIALNEDYEGGELRFPEFGNRGYKPGAGGAIVFSCSLLHMVMSVTAGERYVFVPFLYDERGAKIRERNRKFVQQQAG